MQSKESTNKGFNLDTKQVPVVHLITTLDMGGAESQLLVLVKQQVLKNMKVSVLFLKGSGELVERFEELGVPVLRLSASNNLGAQVLRLRKYLKKVNQPHIVHAHLPQAEILATLSLSHNSRLINSRHFGGQFHPSASATLSRLLGKFASWRSSKIVAISQSVRRILVENNEVKQKVPIEVVHYGFDEKEFRKKGGDWPAKSNSVVRIGTVARLSPEKDLETLIKGFEKLRAEGMNLSLDIVGAGPLLGDLTALVQELHLSEFVSFLGKTSDVAGFMSSLDLFVLTSKFEGFGMVLLEAMSSGCKIVAARNSAIPEVLGNQGAGLFFETGNFHSMAKKIEESLEQIDDGYRQLQIQRLHKFSAEEMCKKMLRVYEVELA
jgi:glycosyltransferase involved in cell wall biosynthesis